MDQGRSIEVASYKDEQRAARERKVRFFPAGLMRPGKLVEIAGGPGGTADYVVEQDGPLRRVAAQVDPATGSWRVVPVRKASKAERKRLKRARRGCRP